MRIDRLVGSAAIMSVLVLAILAGCGGGGGGGGGGCTDSGAKSGSTSSSSSQSTSTSWSVVWSAPSGFFGSVDHGGLLAWFDRLFVVHAANDGHMRGIHFFDANNGWAVGDFGKIIHTTDGGATWVEQSSGTVGTLRDVQFVTPQLGWIVGATTFNPVILVTVTGGATWFSQPLTNNANMINCERIQMLNGGSRGWIGGGGVAYTDDGYVWTSTVRYRGYLGGSNAHFASASVHFLDANRGYIQGLMGLYYTADGLATEPEFRFDWGQAGPFPKDIFFFDENTGWFAGGTLSKTTNGGRSWTAKAQPLAVRFTRVVFLDATHGWATGWGGAIMSTSNGGETWTVDRGGGTDRVYDLSMVSLTRGYAMSQLQVLKFTP